MTPLDHARILAARISDRYTWAEVRVEPSGVYVDYGSILSDGERERAIATLEVGEAVRKIIHL